MTSASLDPKILGIIIDEWESLSLHFVQDGTARRELGTGFYLYTCVKSISIFNSFVFVFHLQ